MAEDREDAYRYWLHGIEKLGDGNKRKLMECFGSAGAVYQAPERRLVQILTEIQMEQIKEWKTKWPVMENYEKMRKKDIHMVSIWDKEYPERLRKMRHPPLVIYYRGRLPEGNRSAAAIIGARECSDYGSFVAKSFGQKLGMAGINIISGMARGIDGIGQKAALDAGGLTFAVLGCGVDICYPSSNREIYQAIWEKGGLLSPFLPGKQPQKTFFPYRNGIVAGLSDAVLVVEARQKSGTWITVDMALEQGKDVYAVPGRLTDRLSDSCNLLIRQGAGIALTPEDVIEELAILKNRQGGEKTEKHSRKLLEARQKKKDRVRQADSGGWEERTDFLRFLDFTPKSSDEILEKARNAGIDITLPQLLFELIQLCMTGRARQAGGNYFVKAG